MNFPKPGFYYHYKHDPAGSFENYAYEVLGVGHHTEFKHEDALDPEEGVLVVYRPLYESAFVYKMGKMFDVRPLRLFMGEVEKDGQKMKRFTPIIDTRLVSRLSSLVSRKKWFRCIINFNQTMNNDKYGKIGIAILFIALAVFSVISEGFSSDAFIVFSILGFCFLLVIGFVSLFGMGKSRKEVLTPAQGSIVVDSKFKFSRAVTLFIIVFSLLIVLFALIGGSLNN